MPEPSNQLGNPLLDVFNIAGKTVVVTGASSGIGQHFATVLLEAGANVVVTARRGARLSAQFDKYRHAVCVTADVTVPEDRERIVATAVERFDRIDVLVNNAGGGASGDPGSVERFEDALALNLTSAYGMSTAAREHLAGGAIVNVASMYGVVAAERPEEDGYVAAKAGLIHLTRHLASTWARDGIRVNAIAPGYFVTEQTDQLLSDERMLGYIRKNSPLKRVGRVEELTGALFFLASGASSYVTGQTLLVDGGWTVR